MYIQFSESLDSSASTSLLCLTKAMVSSSSSSTYSSDELQREEKQLEQIHARGMIVPGANWSPKYYWEREADQI